MKESIQKFKKLKEELDAIETALQERIKLFIDCWADKIEVDETNIHVEYWWRQNNWDEKIPIKRFLSCDTDEKVKDYRARCKRAKEWHDAKSYKRKTREEDMKRIEELALKYPDVIIKKES